MVNNNAKSAAERQRERRDRICSDPVKLEQYKTKSREEWHRYQAKHKTVEDSARVKRVKRKKWREAKRIERDKKKSQLCSSIDLNTCMEAIEIRTENVLPVNESIQNVCVCKQVERDTSALNRMVTRLERDLANERRRNERFRKRLVRINSNLLNRSRLDKSVDCHKP